MFVEVTGEKLVGGLFANPRHLLSFNVTELSIEKKQKFLIIIIAYVLQSIYQKVTPFFVDNS